MSVAIRPRHGARPRLLWLGLVLGLSAALLSVADAQSEQSAPTTTASSAISAPPPHPEDIVEVRARREALENGVRSFVSGVTRTTQESLSRWQVPICPLVAGLPRQKAEFVLVRFSEVANAVGAPLVPRDQEHCSSNFFIIVTDNPEAALKQWRAKDPKMFGDGLAAQIKTFVRTPRPVRAWYNTRLIQADGTPALVEQTARGNTEANYRLNDSRIDLSVVSHFMSIIVVVDLNKVKGVKFGQLTDYIAMVGLGQIEQDADLTGAPTILRLFTAEADGESAPAGLTAWDQAFLKALYKTRQSSTQQRAMIVDSMLNEVSP